MLDPAFLIAFIVACCLLVCFVIVLHGTREGGPFDAPLDFGDTALGTLILGAAISLLASIAVAGRGPLDAGVSRLAPLSAAGVFLIGLVLWLKSRLPWHWVWPGRMPGRAVRLARFSARFALVFLLWPIDVLFGRTVACGAAIAAWSLYMAQQTIDYINQRAAAKA